MNCKAFTFYPVGKKGVLNIINRLMVPKYSLRTINITMQTVCISLGISLARCQILILCFLCGVFYTVCSHICTSYCRSPLNSSSVQTCFFFNSFSHSLPFVTCTALRWSTEGCCTTSCVFFVAALSSIAQICGCSPWWVL